jgi:hypothetical protein
VPIPPLFPWVGVDAGILPDPPIVALYALPPPEPPLRPAYGPGPPPPPPPPDAVTFAEVFAVFANKVADPLAPI